MAQRNAGIILCALPTASIVNHHAYCGNPISPPRHEDREVKKSESFVTLHNLRGARKLSHRAQSEIPRAKRAKDAKLGILFLILCGLCVLCARHSEIRLRLCPFGFALSLRF
jgi:hypothetical protein